MKKAKFFISLIVAAIMVFAPMSAVMAAPTLENSPLIAGMVTFVEVSTDVNTGSTTVLVTVEDAMGVSQTVRISLESAINLVLVYNDGEEVVIVEPLPEYIEIKPKLIIPDEEEAQHPVGSALSTFFSDLEGVDYEAIMDAHEAGTGFGVIAQALWLTRKLTAEEVGEEDVNELLLESDLFLAILQAKKDGDYAAFFPEDATVPANWGQFKKALLDKKANLGAIMSLHDENNDGTSATNNGKGNKDKKNARSNNGNRNGNGHDNGNRP